ncbi:MAG: ABC transporter permease [Kiritimatiellia bacterium]
MRNLLLVARREISAWFLSPFAYGVMALYLFVTGLTFLVGALNAEGTAETIPTVLFGAVLFWLTVLISVVSMRLFAEERRSGTLELLMTVPLREKEIVLGKYLGVLFCLLLVVLVALADGYILPAFSPSVDPPEAGAMVGGIIIIVLLSAFGVAIGLVVSIMTRHQIAAALVAFCSVWLALLSGWLLGNVPFDLMRGVTETLTATRQIEDFARGLVDTRVVVFYLSGTFFLLFAGIRALESERWR